ncbi:MAG: asparagine synthase (glutamine-hydrolyzing) [Planctomycetes bacterium]|nr:asparagine synthase (glutamine-hydrolyzing) [Planctomycetota bacterium]
MCGICGIVRYDTPAWAFAPRMRMMRHRLEHRGPDGQGEYVGTHVALGHTRLAVLDLERGIQPIDSPDGRYTIVYNGEVYDLDVLRGSLAGRWVFRTRSDAEAVLASYAAWGKEGLDRLNGMFAFFVWDRKEQRGFGARDRLGVKPFVYRSRDGEFAFASEAKALLCGRATLHLPSFLEFMAVPCLSGVEHPMFEGLEYLPAGHWIEVSREEIRTGRWWDYEIRDLREDEETLSEELLERLRGAARRSIVADAPVGYFLSGGLDSTLVAALGGPRPAYTICFEGQRRYDYSRSLIVTSDDSDPARLAAGALDLPASLVGVSHEAVVASLKAIAAIDDALPAWEQEVAQYHLSKEAGRQVKVVLVGDAADETHFGYPFLLDCTPRMLMTRFGAERRAEILRVELREGLLDHLERRYVELSEKAGYRWDSPDGRIPALTCLIVKRWLGRLLHNGDIHTMAHGLEARVPFADRDLLDLARHVSPRVGFRDGVEKSLLRRAARGILPESIRTRRKSALPKDQETGPAFQAVLLERLAHHSEFLGRLFDLNAVERLGREPADEIGRAILFNLIAFSYWAEHYGVE